MQLYRKYMMKAVLVLMIGLTGCSQEPAEIHFGSDECVHCKMIITDQRFASQMVTTKGKSMKFDSIECMAAFVNRNQEQSEEAKLWVSDFNKPGQWIPLEMAVIIKSEVIKSPMGESLLALSGNKEVDAHLESYPGKKLRWNQIINQ